MAKQKTNKVEQNDWMQFVESINRGTEIIINDNYAERESKRMELEKNPIQWIQFFFPQYAKYPFANFHKKAIYRITMQPEHYEVLSWSRSLAKSTVTFMSIMYLALTERKKNILMISNSQDNATRLLADYKAAFEGNALIEHYYGKQKTLGSWTEDEFVTKCGASFRAIGAGQSPRGSRNAEYRPDTLLIDDIDTDEECRNTDIINKKWDWFEQAVYGTRDTAIPLLVVFCGNIIAQDCCITRAGAMANHWDVVNIRDNNGNSTWPEKNSEEQIDTVLAKISTKSSQKEYFNNPLQEGDIFKEITYGKVPSLRKFKYLVSYSDPSTSNKDKQKKGTSFKANILLGYLDGIFYIIKSYLDQVTNANFVEWNYAIRDFVGDKTQVFYYIENNSLQDPFYEQVYLPIFEELGESKGFIGITPDTRKKPDKYTRIEGNLEPLNRLGKLVFNESEKENPHMKRLEEQFLLISPQMKSPADGVDAVEGGVYIVNNLNYRSSGDIHSNDIDMYHSNKY